MSHALPTVVIVGRPNVGKSTLFNRIVGRRVAVIEDTPGVTRDRLYAEAEWSGRPFQIVDTGGILFDDNDPLIEQIRVQAQVALAEADAVVFVADAVDGLHPDDQALADKLRGIKAPLFLVANKADNPSRDQLASEFFALGMGEVFPISSLHGRGVADLLDEVCRHFPKVDEMPEKPDEVRLAIVGRPNVGKSSMLNAFTGEKRAIVSDIPGTTRDAIDMLVEYRGEPIRLIDTAGLRRRGKIQGSIEYYMALRAQRALERADCGLVVIDGHEGLTDGDKRIAKAAHDMGRAVVLLANKWDLQEPPDGEIGRRSAIKKDFERIVRDQLPEIGYAPVVFSSAQEVTGMRQALDAVLTALESWSFRIPTGQLNRLIQDAAFAKPYSRKGKILKIYYATQATTRPPTIVLFVNDPELVHFSYLRYLENQLRKTFRLPGTALRLIVRASEGQRKKG